MVKFITKSVCMALIATLCVMSLNAQEFQRVKGEPKEKTFTFASAQKAITPTAHRGSMTDDVEGHTAWTIDSPGSIPWSYYNGNGGGTYGIQTVEFPGAYEPMAYIVFNPAQTTPPTSSNYAPHSGSQFFACFNPTSGATNAWIISPSFTVESNATISFWARALTTQYGPELFKVAVSTTGSAHTDFTTVISPGANVEVNTTTWTQYTYDIPADAKYVAINCVSNDVFALFIDDITISGIGVYVPDPCPEITNLAAEIQGTDAKLTWTAATGEPTGYKVYDGVSVLGTVTATEYVAKNLSAGNHTLGVEALYSDDCLPVKVTTTVSINPGNPVKNLNGTCIDGTLNLTWTEPDGGEGGIIQYSGEPGDGIGTGEAHQITPANRWTPTDLSNAGITTGTMLEQVAFVPYQPANATYTIKVWQGGSWTGNSGTPGTELVSQVLTSSSLVAEQWNIITLDTPVEIDATKELWIGYLTNATTGHPSGVDLGPIAEHTKSNICQMGGWTTLIALNAELTCNWCVRGYCTGDIVLPQVTNYDIYKDDAKLGETTATTFTKEDMQDGKSNYCIVAVYDNDAQSQKVCKEITCIACPSVTGTKAVIEGGCTIATISWTAPAGAKEYKIERDGVAAVTVEASPYVEEFDFEDGETYTWTITTICPSGKESDGVIAEAKANCVGINELANSVAIYPNPTSGMITITADNFSKVEIYNTVGQLIETKTVDTFDVASYNTGIYFFKVYDVYNNNVTKRVMVAK